VGARVGEKNAGPPITPTLTLENLMEVCQK